MPQRGADNPADLYECEIVEAAGAIGCNLKDLTVDLNGGEAAGVLNLVPGASEDGSVVYFVANGALAAGATPGHCKDAGDEGEPPPPGTTCNLYVYRADPQHPGQFRTTFIAALSAEDEPDWGSSNGNESNLGYVTSRVSPSGTYLAFMSDRGLTGYNNKDVNSGRPDEEVYLYDSSTRRLVCASCNPTGAPPVGVLDTQNSGEGLGLVDRSQNSGRIAGSRGASPAGRRLSCTAASTSRAICQTPDGCSSTPQTRSRHRTPTGGSRKGRTFTSTSRPVKAAAFRRAAASR